MTPYLDLKLLRRSRTCAQARRYWLFEIAENRRQTFVFALEFLAAAAEERNLESYSDVFKAAGQKKNMYASIGRLNALRSQKKKDSHSREVAIF